MQEVNRNQCLCTCTDGGDNPSLSASFPLSYIISARIFESALSSARYFRLFHSHAASVGGDPGTAMNKTYPPGDGRTFLIPHTITLTFC